MKCIKCSRELEVTEIGKGEEEIAILYKCNYCLHCGLAFIKNCDYRQVEEI
ncbi:MAG: hypothetical protein ACRCX8_18560 [Sarcina sp.]